MCWCGRHREGAVAGGLEDAQPLLRLRRPRDALAAVPAPRYDGDCLISQTGCRHLYSFLGPYIYINTYDALAAVPAPPPSADFQNDPKWR